MALPPLTAAQRAAALEKAAAARRQRAALKKLLKSGDCSLRDLLDQGAGDEAVGKMKVVAVLEALPGVGKVRAQHLLVELDISPSRRVRGIGARQRGALLKAFPGKQPEVGAPAGPPPPATTDAPHGGLPSTVPPAVKLPPTVPPPPLPPPKLPTLAAPLPAGRPGVPPA